MKQGLSSLPVRRLAAELVVIVVGVLVALAVDDLRERRADHDLARHLLESVAADLRADVAELEGVLRDARSVQEASDRILIEAGRPSSDGAATRDPSELAPDVAILIDGIDFDLSDVAYREMTSTGSSQVLPNDLRREIAQYYWLVQSYNITYSTFEEHRIGLQRALVRLGVAPLRPEVPRLEVAVSDPEVRALVAELGARGELMESAHERFLEAATALLAKTEDQAGRER
jgi:hypothetical protein